MMYRHIKTNRLLFRLGIAFFFLIGFSSKSIGQEYFNTIIPFEFGNPNPAGIYKLQNNFIIPVIYPGEVSTIVQTDLDNTFYYHFDYFDFSKNPLGIIDHSFYLFAKDRSMDKALKLKCTDNTINEKWEISIETPGEWNFASRLSNISDKIYCSYGFDLNGGSIRNIGLAKFDKDGGEIFNNTYNQDYELSIVWDHKSSLDSQIILSTGVHYFNQLGRYSQVLKIDTMGSIVWEYLGDEEFENGATPAWITQLSNNTFVQSYEVFRWNDPEFILNDWEQKTTRFIWLDSMGTQIDQHFQVTPDNERIKYRGLKTVEGGFIAYGYYDRSEDTYGLIAKYSNTGEKIWSHRYFHPEFENSEHVINDLIIEDDGDIISCGNIFTPGESVKLWVFQVNEFGCFGDPDCEELVLSTHDLGTPSQPLTIYPNPASAHITIDYEDQIPESIWVFDVFGNLVKGFSTHQASKELNISDLVPGTYFIQVKTESDKILTGKFLKFVE